MLKNTEGLTLEQKLSNLAKTKIEITVRGDQEFTFSTETVNKKAAQIIADFFRSDAKQIEITHDDECGSFVYINV